MSGKRSSEIEAVAKTVGELATPGMRPKQLLEAVRKRHPEVSKKEVTRAAFYAVIIAAEREPERAKELHDVATGARNSPEGESEI